METATAAAPVLTTKPHAVSDGTYSVAEYLEIEARSGERHLYLNGKIIPMAGGSLPHNRIARNLLQHLGNLLDSKNQSFEVFGSDQKVYLPEYNFYVYPDAIVVAELPIMSEKQADAIINPVLVVEVLSHSTESYDRGQKFVEYRSLPSFKEYALVRQDKPEVVTFFREKPGVWLDEEFKGQESEVYFKSIDVRLALSLVYRKVEFEQTV